MITGSLLSTAVALGRGDHNIEVAQMRLVAIAERIIDAQAGAEQRPC
jgi:hypothetical protein